MRKSMSSLSAVILAGILAGSSVAPAQSRWDRDGQDERPVIAGAHDVLADLPEDLNNADQPPMLGIHWSRDVAQGFADRARRGRRSPNMTYHGGKIMPTVVSKAIFWGPSWTSNVFVADKIVGLNLWYNGHSDSNYAATVNEYTDTVGQGHEVGSTGFVHQGHIIDPSTASGGSSTSAILNEVCKQITAGNIVPDPAGNGYYPVYVDVKRGNASYCAYHSVGTCQGHSVQFAFFFNLDGDAGCDPKDTQTAHSQGLAALANVTAHEISEARSDPATPGAWYDSSGAENGDKCAWTFNVPFVTFPNGTSWKLQGEWSNAAFTAGTGYPNSSNQKGCLDGH
jgi:hypothetical protein